MNFHLLDTGQNCLVPVTYQSIPPWTLLGLAHPGSAKHQEIAVVHSPMISDHPG